MKLPLYILLFLCLFFYGCNKKHEASIDIVNEWMGKEIFFPQNTQCYSITNDSISFSSLLKKEFKILFYVNSNDCFKCKARLADWNKLIYNFNQLYSDKVSFLFFYHIKKEEKDEVYKLLEYERFYYPVIIDQANAINQLNNLPIEESFQCFLLNKENKVISIGNPTINNQVLSLYKRYITKKKKTLFE